MLMMAVVAVVMIFWNPSGQHGPQTNPEEFHQDHTRLFFFPVGFLALVAKLFARNSVVFVPSRAPDSSSSIASTWPGSCLYLGCNIFSSVHELYLDFLVSTLSHALLLSLSFVSVLLRRWQAWFQKLEQLKRYERRSIHTQRCRVTRCATVDSYTTLFNFKQETRKRWICMKN